MEKTTKLIFNFSHDKVVRLIPINGNLNMSVLGNQKEKLIPFIQKMKEEVKSQPKKERKNIIKHLQAMSVTLVITLKSTETSQAQTLSIYQSQSSTQKSELLPTEITDILKQLILACEAIAVLLACIFLIVSGIYWMIGNKQKSKQWTEDIIKGLGLTILAPVTILLLVKIVSTVFKNTPIFEAFF